MAYTRLKVSVSDRIGHIELSVPDELNRMPPAFWTEFPAALEELDRRGDVRALIISSTGRHFTAGMDVSAFTGDRQARLDRGRAGEASRRHLDRLQRVFSRLEALRMPVLAAVQGGCIGGGVDMIAACDVRYCTADAFFCIQEINIGMAADVGVLAGGWLSGVLIQRGSTPAASRLRVMLVCAAVVPLAALIPHAGDLWPALVLGMLAVLAHLAWLINLSALVVFAEHRGFGLTYPAVAAGGDQSGWQPDAEHVGVLTEG